ncbi:putative membrane protein [Sphingobacterium paludis]|uniref:Putative membrane protein n=2 Tax=Sphingobacterium paludis TaxID=1476465 RepID=A0A4R7D0Y1_9SPHI|nr:putative membrane protein [Sphingobacterium paludis]
MKKYVILCVSILGTLCMTNSTVYGQQDTVTTETMDQQFIDKAVNLNRFKVAVASQAIERSKNDEVKQFAQTLLTDHKRVLEEIEQAAVAKKLILPEKMDENHASILKSMGELSGPDLNKAFKDVVIKSHEDAIALFEMGAGQNGLNDPELKTWASEKIQPLKSHLESARALDVDAGQAVSEALSIL